MASMVTLPRLQRQKRLRRERRRQRRPFLNLRVRPDMQQKVISVRCSIAAQLKNLVMAEHLVVKHGMKGLCYLLTSDMQRISSSDMRGAFAEGHYCSDAERL